MDTSSSTLQLPVLSLVLFKYLKASKKHLLEGLGRIFFGVKTWTSAGVFGCAVVFDRKLLKMEHATAPFACHLSNSDNLLDAVLLSFSRHQEMVCIA